MQFHIRGGPSTSVDIQGQLETAPNGSLDAPPNKRDLNFLAECTLFDRNTGRPACAGDGDQCRRRHDEGMKQLPCPSPTYCQFAAGGKCKPYGRLNVIVGDQDPLGTFIFRTTGFNSIRTLMARLKFFQAVSGGLLACLPLELRLRGKSTTQSRRAPIFYVDLAIREGVTLEAAITHARELAQQRQVAGYDQAALDQAARAALASSAFEDDEEETPVPRNRSTCLFDDQ